MATKAEMLKKKQQDAAALENARKIAKEHNEVLNTAKATLPSIKRPEFNAQNSVTTNSLKGTENYNPTIMGLAQDLAQKKMFDPDTMQAVNPVSNTNEPVGSGRKFGASNTELFPVSNGDMDDPENWPTADKVRNDRLLKSDLAELKAKMDENKTNPIENAAAFLPAVTGAAGKYAKAKQDAYKQAKKDYQDALVLQMNQAVRSEPGYSTMSSPVDDPARATDPMYAVINGTNVTALTGVGEIAKSLFTGANYTESKYMTDDDRQTYNYIYNTRGKEAATEYYNALMPQLTEREFRDNFDKASQRVSNTSGLGYAGSIVGSWTENAEHALLGVGDAVRQAGEYLFTGDIDKNDWQRYSITRTIEANTQGVSQHIMDKYKDDPKKAANMAKWGTFGYSTVQSIINSTIQALTGQSIVGLANKAGGGMNAAGMLTETTANVASGKGAGMLFRSYLGEAEAKKAEELALDLMATSAMSSSTLEAMDRGIEAPKALLTGIIAGMAEWLTEKVGLDELFNAAQLEQNAFKYWQRNILSETLEEISSDIINLNADIFINADKSEWMENIKLLKKGGYSDWEIVGKMAWDKTLDMLMSGLGGGISGAFTSGSQIAMYKSSNAYVGSRLAGNEASVIETGLNTDEGTLTNQLAKQLQEKQASGKKLSKEEIGRLAGLNAQAFQAKAAFDKADTAVERDLEMAGKQNEAILEAGMEADKNSQAYQLAQEMSSDQSKQTQENYYRLENLNQQEDAQLPDSKKNASHNVAVAYQVQNDIETTGKLSKGTAEALKTASTQLSNEEAESNLTGRVAVDVGNDVGYIDDIGKTLNVYHDTESGTDVITVEVERNGRTETVGIDELAFHNTEVTQAVENATDFIQDVNASDEQKTGIIKSFLQGYLQYASNGSTISLKDYTAGFKFLFEAGANGQSIMSVSENVSSAMKGILDRMSVAQKSLAIFAGQNSQVINGKLSSSAEFKSNISAAKRESMSAEERKNLETNEAFLGQLSRWVGKSVTLEEKVFGSDGEEVNAFYDPETDSYKISLNATADAVAYIAIHETIHDIRINNKEGFLELARVTLRVLEEHRAGSASRYNKYLESLYGELSQEDILEEVIANTVPVILRNKSTREALADRMAYSENRKARNAFVRLIEGASKFFAQCATRLSKEDKVSFSQFNDGIESDRQACEDILDAYTKAIEGIHKEAVDTVKNSGVKYSKTSIRNAAISYLEDKIRFSKKKEALHKATMTLFSGSGLFEHGMPDHYTPYVACEFFEDVRKLYKANHPEVFSIENDVNTMDYAKYKGKVQHLHMSPCCQQFSPMNNKTEILKDNARDRQFAESCARAIAQVEAPTISIEQVKQYLGSESEAIILKALEENGYKIVRGIYNAADYGSYTSRERYWLLAAKDFQPVEPPKGIDTKQNWKQCLTDDIIDSMEDSTYPESWVEKAKNTPRIGGIGVTLENVPMDLIILGTAKGGQFRCAYADELCPTITASDDEARIIRPDGTVKKVRAVHLAKLMGLDNYVFQKTKAGKIAEERNIHAIGNGIPTQMTNAFLMALENSADERLEQASAEASVNVNRVRYSNKADADYLALAEKENRTAEEDAQLREMVDQAAKDAGYSSRMYHGSKKGGGFNEFRDWSYFTENKAYAERYTERDNPSSLYSVYVKLENTFDTRKPKDRRLFNKIRLELGLSRIQENGLPDWTDGYDISDYIDENDLQYDSVVLNEGGDMVDGKPVYRGDSYVVRKSNQVKSADLVVRDDNGNIIPLSQRFNQEEKDIRYSKKSQEDPRVTSIIERTNEVRNELIDVRNQMKDIENSDAFNDVVQDYMNIDIDAVAKFFRTSGYDDLETRKKNLQEELNKLSKQYDELYKEIALAEEHETIEKSGLSEQDWRRKQAIKEFGYTPYYYDAGYMLPDGKLLNFSGEKGRHFGSRGQDHRGISAVYATYDSLSDTMIDFMNGGNIRIMDESPGIDISNVTELTAAQYAGIRKYARTKLADNVFYVDVSDENGRTIWSKQYDKVSADRVVADIKSYFDTGNVPGEDTVASFHRRYSIKSSQLTPEMIAELDNDAVTALNVNQAGKLMYATEIAKKAKLEETRESPIRFIGKDGKMHLLEVGMRVGIVATGKNGGGKLIAYATVSKINVYNNADEFHNNDVKDENGRTAQERHLVPANSKYDIKEGGVKYGYEFDPDSITELKTPIPTVWNGPSGTRKLDIVDSIDYKELIVEDGGRKFIDYDDRETADRAVSEKHKEMLNRGIYHDVNDNDFDKYQQYFDDNGRPNKELFDLLRKDINNDLDKSYYQFKISIGNSIFYTAEAGHSFATHAVPLERAHIKPIDAAVFTRIRDVIGQMEYVYSSYNDDHKANFVDSDIWDYFYTPVKGGNRDRTGVLVGIRRLLSGYEGNNHQIYSYKKKKQLRSTGSANITTNVGDTNRELSAATTDIVASNEPAVNTTGSKIRESRKSSVEAIERVMLENEKMKDYIGSAKQLAKLGITATDKQASLTQARWVASEVKTMFGATMSGEDIAKEIVKAYTPIAQGSDDADAIMAANDALMDLAMRIAQSSKNSYRPAQEQYDTLKSFTDKAVIQLTATQVEDVKHKYGSIAEFNRMLFKAGTSMRVTVSKGKSTIDMDSWYHAMTDTPEGLSLASLLPADANEGDQPSLILEALEAYGEKSVAGEWEKLGITVDEYAGEIYGTLAEKAVEAKLESSKELAKNRTAEAMQDVDAEHQAELDAMQAELDKMAEEKAKWKEQLSKEYAEGYDAAKAEVGRRITDLEEAITMLKEESRKKLDEKLSKQKAEDKLKYKQAVDKLKSQLMKLRDQMKTNQEREAKLLRFTASLIGTEKHLGEWRKNLAVEKLKNEFKTAIAQAMDGDYKGMMDAVTSYTRGMQGIRNQLMGLEKKGIREGKLAEKQAEHHRKTRAKIAATVKDLASRLVAGNDRTAIPEVAREPITQFVSLFTDDTTRKGILNKKQASQIVGKLAKWYDAIDVNGKDVKSVKNQADLRNLLGWMYDIDISQDLADLEDALSDDDGATISLAKMDQETLDKVLRIAQHMKHIATHADEDIRKSGKRAKLSQLGMQAMRQAQTSHRKNKFWSKATKLFDNNITPYYFFKRMGGVWQDLYNDIDESTRTYVFEVEKASETVASLKDKYHWKDWSHKKGDTLTIKTLDGTEMALTREQALSIYATDRREMSDNYQQANHLRGEGIRLEGEEITKNHALTNENIAAINEWLTDEQKAYADAMVKYMSGPLADIGNETSIRMYGYKKYLEPYYFPFGSNRAELYEDLKGSEGKGNDDPRIKNASFTKRTTKFANSGLLISDFTNVCGNHISQMLLYSTMAESLENMNRVFNWQTPARDEKLGQTQSKISVKSVIENTYGANTADYIRDFMKDVNGGTSRDRRDIAGGWLLSAFKRSSVMASLSVTIQQPSAIGRALAYIDPKYFVGKNTGGFEQAKKYAYTAVLKEIGGFDVAMGRSMADRVVGGIYEDSKLRRFDNLMNDIAGKLPEKADEFTWGRIWNAVKRETMAKNPDLKGEELLQAAGRRFDQVINATQVYDNQLSKSGNMRAKDWYMKAVTSFMAEPTVSFNMLYDAVASVKQNPTAENKKAGARAIGAVATAMVINSILKSIISALRHKKDDEPYIETYVSEFVGNIMDEANPFGMLPLYRDIYSLFQGYDVDRADMSVVSDMANSVKGFVSLAFKDEPSKEEEYKAWKNFIGSVSKLTSVPVANVWRDVEALYNSIVKPIIKVSKGEDLPKAEKLGFEIGIEDALAGFIPFTLYRTGNGEWKRKAGKALVKGDTGEFEHRMAMYELNQDRNGKEAKMDQWAKDAIKGVRDKLPSEKITGYLEEYAGEDGKDAYGTVAKWETGTNSAYDRLYQAIDTKDFDKVLKEMVDAGYEEKDVRSQVKSYIRDSYKGKNDRASISAEDAESKLVRYAGMARDEAHSQVMKDNCYRTYGVEYDKADDAVLEGTLTMAQYRKILKVCGGKSDKDIDKAVEKLEKKLNK